MYLYKNYAVGDAIDLALLLKQYCTQNNYSVEVLAKRFKQLKVAGVKDFIARNMELIAAFIAKAPSQRIAYIKRMSKKETPETIALFLLMCIIGVNQAIIYFSERADMPYHANWGSYRMRTAESFISAFESPFLRGDYSWPEEALLEVGVDMSTLF